MKLSSVCASDRDLSCCTMSHFDCMPAFWRTWYLHFQPWRWKYVFLWNSGTQPKCHMMQQPTRPPSVYIYIAMSISNSTLSLLLTNVLIVGLTRVAWMLKTSQCWSEDSTVYMKLVAYRTGCLRVNPADSYLESF